MLSHLTVTAQPARFLLRITLILSGEETPASGDHGGRPVPLCSAAGTTSYSISRQARLYCCCSVTGNTAPMALAVDMNSCSCQPVKLDNPK